MPNSIVRDAANERAETEIYENVTCPFCGILCDDLKVERTGHSLKVLKNGCGRSTAGFERKLPPSSPQIGGKDVDLPKAIKAAAELIGKSKCPLYGGLATGVEGMRGVMALADRTGGIVDHALSEAQYRNFRVLQTQGWVMSTLTEVRNRADLIIVVGSDIHKLHQRFFERVVAPAESMFDSPTNKRTVVFLGKGPDLPEVGKVITLPCAIEYVGQLVGVLRARLRGFRVKDFDIDGVTLADIDDLAERCRNAAYGVITWAPPSLAFAHGELAVGQIAGLARDLNQTIRFVGLALGGAEGAVTAGAVSAWQSGYPLRISYASGAPEYDPYRYSIGRMLAAGEADLLMWIASISPDLGPPPTKVPTIVLGTPGLKLTEPPAVFIPVGTPGIDHSARLVRVDNVVSLPLKNLGRSTLPRVPDILASIQAAL
jgi:formylmethanofuran dehydrogenase subunit B